MRGRKVKSRDCALASDLVRADNAGPRGARGWNAKAQRA